MGNWYTPEDKDKKYPMDDIALSVYMTKQLAKRQQEFQLAQQAIVDSYKNFADYRNANVAEIAAKVEKVDPAKVHQPLENILKTKGIEVDIAVDFIGGDAKHTQWLFDQHQANVIYTDVNNLTQNLPNKFSALLSQKNENGSILLLDEGKENHWIYGATSLPNEVHVVKSALSELNETGRAKEKKTQLFLGNDMFNWVVEAQYEDFSRGVNDILEPGAIIDISARNMTKFGKPIDDPKQISKLFSGYDILYAEAEEPVSQNGKEGKKHIRVIMQKPIAA